MLLGKVGSGWPNDLKKREMICSQYFHNMFTTNPKWQVVTGCYWLLLLGQKSNLSVKFKFKPITINYL